ncbi:SusC/RagA family TonB-linked outer membrane protein [Aquimarina celericrescens]|uniref:SusC/RagA family TonB-linked outer membrane protein n=1 Tax=Aquimarina celericrescens TaxID=1964542 RepID=A0ABW5AZJ8_9FLAO|nr:TonB-dependent receptor [Aquimarina celericrescens]
MDKQIENYSCILDNSNSRLRIIRGKLFFVLLFFQLSSIYAETHTKTAINNIDVDNFSVQSLISGTVTDGNGSPLPGASVLVKGTSIGASTDFDGNYSIQASTNDILVFSYIGFIAQEVPVGSRTTINITLEEDASELDEIVVVGYGTRAKKDLTGAVSTLSADELSPQINSSPEFAIQGRLPGVFISNPGSNPNSRPDVRIRGVSTLGFNDPLYVIDGVPVIEGGAASNDARTQDNRGSINILNLINPNDIKSVTVLKDASATAIYGVRASNGVILIETKRGTKGRTNVNFSQRFGIQTLTKRYNTLSTSQYVDVANQAWTNNPAESREDDQFGSLYDPNSSEFLGNNPTFDWVDRGVRNTSVVQDYNVSITGGSDKSNYAVSVGYTGQEDVLFDTEFERYSFSINSDHKVTDWLKLGQSYRIAITDSPDEVVFDSNLFRTLTFAAPWQPIEDPNGPQGFATIGGPGGFGNGTIANYFGYAPFWEQRSLLIRNLGSVYAELNPLPGLKLRGTVSIDYYTNRRDQLRLPQSGLFREGPIQPDNFARRLTTNYNLTSEFLIGYNKNFGRHNFDVTLNVMDQKTQWDISNVAATNTGITSFEQRSIEEALAAENRSGFLVRNESGLQGYLARLSYNFDSKYYIDGTIRRDGSSKFADGFKWGTFPAFAVAWRISSEGFMQNLKWLNDLKIRAGYGQTGNQETRDFAFLSLVNNNPSYPTGDGTLNPGAALGDFPVIDTSWETVTSTNIGMDGTLFNNKLNFTAEYYFRETEDILQEIDIPLVIGALTKPVVNLATVENKGFELSMGYSDNFGKLGFNANVNLTTVKNEVTKLFNDTPQGSDQSRIALGQPIGYLYGFQTDGILQNEQEVQAYRTAIDGTDRSNQAAPGDFRFRDLNTESDDVIDGTPGADGRLTSQDRTYLGKTIPGYYYGINLGLDYKGFDLGVFFRGVGDVQKYNREKERGEAIGSIGNNYFTSVLDSWTPSNPSNDNPRIVASDPAANNRFSDRWVEDADFLRLQNLTLGYTFGPEILEKFRANNLRVYSTLSNVFVITPYTGLDPEDDTTPFTLTMGLNIGF